MKIENGKIIEATVDELYAHWLNDTVGYQVSFKEYINIFKWIGCKVIEKDAIKLTNGDKIRAMSNEELADMFVSYSVWNDREKALKWLRSEAY